MATPESETGIEFLMKEYESLRIEMNDAIKETRAIERNAVIATGVIWSWLAVATSTPYRQLAWLPALLVVFSALRALGLTWHIDKLAGYLKKIEDRVAPDELGFERSFNGALTLKRLSAYFFWILLFITTIVIPIAF